MYMNKDIVLACASKGINICSGKHCFNVCLKRHWNLFGSLFGIGCCRCNYHVESECVVGMNGYTNKCVTEDMKKMLSEGKDIDEGYDSYKDSVMDIEEFISWNKEKIGKEG